MMKAMMMMLKINKNIPTHLNLNLNKYTLMRGENIMTILYITVNDVKNVSKMNQNHRKM
jgi:hypothetical protein